MQIGSIVETVGDFEDLREEWSLPYPKIGDILTVSGISPHSNKECREKGIVLLDFEELPTLPGVCDKTLEGVDNFIELQLPDDLEEILNAPIEVEEEVFV